MQKSPDLPRAAMLGIAFTQGVCLYLLYRSADQDLWPSESPLWAFPLWTLAILAPLLLLLSVTRSNLRSASLQVAAFSALLALLALYTGWQSEPHDAFPVGYIVTTFTISIGLAAFKALMYIQQRADGQPMSYAVLFTNSWRNFLVGVLSTIFTCIFWLILQLWGGLFEVIGIDFFDELFSKEWFVIPLLSVAFGTGVMLFRNLTRVIDSITGLLHWLLKLLLPLVLVVATIFLAALPFTGLELLWDTGSGTALLLALLAVTLFFTNAVYQDGREAKPYPVFLHRAISVALLTMPVVAALAFYGLLLRLMQYGWTVERSWAFVVWLVLALFALGYVAGIVRRRDAWTGELARVNTLMGLVVLGIMLLANSPFMDFRKISLASQLDRVEAGEIELADFDFWYVRNYLGRPGWLEMEAMKAEIGDSDPDLLDKIEHPVRVWAGRPTINTERFWSQVRFRPAGLSVPGDLRPVIERSVYALNDQTPVLFEVNLDDDDQAEYLLVQLTEYGVGQSQYFDHDGSRWVNGFLNQHYTSGISELEKAILEGEIRLEAPKYSNVVIGGVVFRPMVNAPLATAAAELSEQQDAEEENDEAEE